MHIASAVALGSAEELAVRVMTEFADRTGLSSSRPAKRYLWTDAFAVCTFLALWRTTGNKVFLDLANRLIDQVHNTLGKHRLDDPRSGWISGLSEAEGQDHPTRGGLRIGKLLPERLRNEPRDPELEWEQDGQYFHYLTQWMHALDQAARATKNPRYSQWAQELAVRSHEAFTYLHPVTDRRFMAWKMSIDLSRIVVPSMGQHDPLDGYITCAQLRATVSNLGASKNPALAGVQADFATMSEARAWATPDPLGIGGLLWNAYRGDQLCQRGDFFDETLVPEMLQAALTGLRSYAPQHRQTRPAAERLAFRELGLAIGLKAMAKMNSANGILKVRDPGVDSLLLSLRPYLQLQPLIQSFWSNSDHRRDETWSAHRDINAVMLATNLLPDGFVTLSGLGDN